MTIDDYRRAISVAEARASEVEKRETTEKRDLTRRALEGVRAILEQAYPEADQILEERLEALHVDERDASMIRIEYEALKVEFVREWLENNLPTTTNNRRLSPDDEQIAAITAVHGNNLVVARAGSGKTLVLVNRAFFLMKHCGVSPSEILLLAFNRKAATEMRRRLLCISSEGSAAEVQREVEHRRSKVRGHPGHNSIDIEVAAIDAVAARRHITLPHVMTFHALAHSIVHPDEEILYDDSSQGREGLSSVVQEVIDSLLQDNRTAAAVRRVMLQHFREDWDRIVSRGHELNQESQLKFLRSLPRESISGRYVKSWGEKVIADFLFEHDIPHEYERNWRWNGTNYRPDFTIYKTRESGVIIEYFGLKGDSDYDKDAGRKRQYWHDRDGWDLVEFSPAEIRDKQVEEFQSLAKHKLEDYGIKCVRLSEEEIWRRLKNRPIDRFTKAMVNFIGRCRKQSLTSHELRALADKHSPLCDSERDFLSLAIVVYDAYLERLSAANEEDFDGLIQRAADSVSSGVTVFMSRHSTGDIRHLRHVAVDEFQDFSQLFFRLLDAMRKQNPSLRLFCVGDDWQAINGFAGSDLRFFQHFEEHVGATQTLCLTANYRSARQIVDVGNHLMSGMGQPAQARADTAGEVTIADIGCFVPSAVERNRHAGDYITPSVLRLVSRALKDGLNVVVLSRRNDIPWPVHPGEAAGSDPQGLESFLKAIRGFFPKKLAGKVVASTTHQFKGLERHMVILIDAIARSYPLIHPDWVFTRVLGQTLSELVAEERRLFYVAITRAITRVVLVTDGQQMSPFVQEIENHVRLPRLDWESYPAVVEPTSDLIVRVGAQSNRGSSPTYERRTQLKACGYLWQPVGRPGWYKLVPSAGFSIETIKLEIWTQAADGIELTVADAHEKPLACYRIDDGEWQCTYDTLNSLAGAVQPALDASE